MLVVKVEVWPGGREAGAREIHRIQAGNISGLADVSDYVYWIDSPDRDPVDADYITEHRRADGALTLLRRMLEVSGY